MPPYLEELYIDNNLISSFRPSDVDFFNRLVDNSNLTMKLGNNPYKCSCDSKELYYFVKYGGGRIKDRYLVKCETGYGYMPLWSALLEDFCEPTTTSISVGGGEGRFFKTSESMMTVILSIIVTVILNA